MVIFPYNSLYTQAAVYTTYFEFGEPVQPLQLSWGEIWRELLVFVALWCRLMQSKSSDRTFKWPKPPSMFLLKSWQLQVQSPQEIVFGRKPIQLQKQILAFIWYMSNTKVIRSVVMQIKIGVWPGTGFKWQMVSTISVQMFHLGILDYLSRPSIYFGKFPFGQTRTVLPFTWYQPKFQEFFGKIMVNNLKLENLLRWSFFTFIY